MAVRKQNLMEELKKAQATLARLMDERDKSMRHLTESLAEKDKMIANLFKKNEKLKRKLAHEKKKTMVFEQKTLDRSITSKFIDTIKQQSEAFPDVKQMIRHHFGCRKTLEELIRRGRYESLSCKLICFMNDYFGVGGRLTSTTAESDRDFTLEDRAMGMLSTIGTQADRLSKLNNEIKEIVKNNRF